MTALFLIAILTASMQGVDASSSLEPGPGSTAATGQRLIWTVTLSGRDADAAVLDGDPAFGPEWAVLDGPTPVVDSRLPASARPGLELRWTLMGLEGGELETPALRFTLGDGEPLGAPPARIELAGALSESEDAPRPLAGFREPDEPDVGDANLALLVAAVLLVVACLPLLFRSRRGGGAQEPAAAEPDLLEQITGLDPSGQPAGAMGALGPLLRRAVDEARGADHGSLTDGEWVASLEGARGVTPERGAELAALLDQLSLVRFGGLEPSSFSAREAVDRAEAHVRALRAGAEGGVVG